MRLNIFIMTKLMEDGLSIRIERPLYEHEQLRHDFDYSKKKLKDGTEKLCVSCTPSQAKKSLLSVLPVLEWLPHYHWKENILSDIISGFTVAIMHIPQGMAYGLLGNVPPVVGIYMAFFPVLIYFFLGTSRHNSMGTFAVVCLMTGKAVLEHAHPSFFTKSSNFDLSSNTTGENPNIESLDNFYTPIQVASAVTFTVALFQIGMYCLRLGAISVLLSETLVNGFTTGAAFQVIASQIKDLLGLKINREKGFFVVIKTLRNVFEAISTVNYTAVVISAITIVILAANNEILKPILAKRTSFPVPIELIAIIIGTLSSKFGQLTESFGIATVGEIPNGIPVPSPPPFSLLSSVILDGFTIAVVSYSITLSMALIFAQKMNYEIDANQELLAQGAGNIFGSFFSCMPVSASLSRSMIQFTVGGKTQIATLVSCAILLCILLWIGPFFEPLPKCVLASLIVVSLKGMLMQVTFLWKFWKLSKMDALVWLSTFLTVVIVSIDIGLLVGVIVSLSTIFIQNFKPYTCLLGAVPNTDIYVDTKKYKKACENPSIKIFHYSGALNFATRNIFKSELLRLLQINPKKQLNYRNKINKYTKMLDKSIVQDVKEKMTRVERKMNKTLKCVILDFSGISYADPSGASMLQIVIESFNKIGISIYIAACSDPIFELLRRCDVIKSKNDECVKMFVTVHDAMERANENFGDGSVSIISRL